MPGAKSSPASRRPEASRHITSFAREFLTDSPLMLAAIMPRLVEIVKGKLYSFFRLPFLLRDLDGIMSQALSDDLLILSEMA